MGGREEAMWLEHRAKEAINETRKGEERQIMEDLSGHGQGSACGVDTEMGLPTSRG